MTAWVSHMTYGQEQGLLQERALRTHICTHTRTHTYTHTHTHTHTLAGSRNVHVCVISIYCLSLSDSPTPIMQMEPPSFAWPAPAAIMSSGIVSARLLHSTNEVENGAKSCKSHSIMQSHVAVLFQHLCHMSSYDPGLDYFFKMCHYGDLCRCASVR